jgi:spermidine synthase
MTGADPTELPPDTTRLPTLLAVFALGVSCVITQLALMREMLGVFAGNELVLGVVLGNWLLLMGLGAALGRQVRTLPPAHAALIGLLLLTAILPPAQIVWLRGLRQSVFLRGEEIGLPHTALGSFLLLLPYCLAAGAFLTVACAALARRNPVLGAGRVYAMDSLGSVAGGLLFGFVLIERLDHVALLGVPALLNVLAAAWLGWRTQREPRLARRLLPLAALLLGAGLLGWIALGHPDATSTACQFANQRLLFRGNSPYGRLVVTESGGQTNFIENGLVLASAPGIEQAEECAHLALAQRPGAQQVLLIGGALTGTTREMLRHGVKAIDCVELDPLVIQLGREFLPGEFADPRVRWWKTDARRFVARAGANYDVVVVALPDPVTVQLNRFFTREFFEEVRRVLQPGGVLSFAVGRYENYVSPELARLVSCARQTVACSFTNVLLLPASRIYFLASDDPLTKDIASALDRAGVSARWVNRGYLSATLAPDRLADLERSAAQGASVNRDFAPRLPYLQLKHWASQFHGLPAWWLLAPAGAVLLYAARLRGAAGVVLASGFAGSALEIVLLLGMQVLAGAVYRQVAWVVTAFMAGLALGAAVATRWLQQHHPPSPGGGGLRASIAGSLPETRPGTILAAVAVVCDRRFWAVARAGSGAPRAPLQVLHGLLGLTALGVAALGFSLPALLPALSKLTGLPTGDSAAQGALLLLTLGLAALVGAQFPLANATMPDDSHPAARLYAADFFGASFGALLTSAWLLPVVGVTGVCLIAGGMNLAASLLVFRRSSPL